MSIYTSRNLGRFIPTARISITHLGNILVPVLQPNINTISVGETMQNRVNDIQPYLLGEFTMHLDVILIMSDLMSLSLLKTVGTSE